MGLARYQVTVISAQTGTTLKVFDDTGLALQYSRALNSIGSVALTLPYLPEYDELFALDDFLEIARFDPVLGALRVEETYFIRLFHKFRDGDQEHYLVGGQSLNYLIPGRTVRPNDDPLQAGGYSTKAGDAATLIYQYAREQMGDLASAARRVPGLTIVGPVLSGVQTGEHLRYDKLYEVLQRLADKGNTDFQIVRAGGNALQMLIGVQGVNRTLDANYPAVASTVLDPRRGNLMNPSLQIDHKDEATYLYYLGSGQGANQIVLEVQEDAINDSPFNRREIVVKASGGDKSTPALQMLLDAQTALKDKEAKVEFKFDVPPNLPSNAYRREWDLGDRLTAQWGNFLQNVRVTQIDVELSDGGEEISVTTKGLTS